MSPGVLLSASVQSSPVVSPGVAETVVPHLPLTPRAAPLSLSCLFQKLLELQALLGGAGVVVLLWATGLPLLPKGWGL